MNLLSMLIEHKLGLKKRNTKTASVINSMIYDIAKEYQQRLNEEEGSQDVNVEDLDIKAGKKMGSSGMGSLAMVSLSLNEGSNQYSHVQSRVHNKSMNSQMSSTYTGGYMS